MTTREVEVNESGESRAEFFAAVRQRGVLNSILDGPAKLYEKTHPGKRTRWEYAPPSGDNTFIVAREALGFKIVDASELSDYMSESFEKSGPLRRGDLVLMAADKEIVDMLDEDDARAAAEDLKLPERTFREALESLKVRTMSGSEDYAKPVGNIKRSVEELQVKLPKQEG